MHDLDGSDVLSIMGAALRKLQGWSEKAWLAEMSRCASRPSFWTAEEMHC